MKLAAIYLGIFISLLIGSLSLAQGDAIANLKSGLRLHLLGIKEDLGVDLARGYSERKDSKDSAQTLITRSQVAVCFDLGRLLEKASFFSLDIQKADPDKKSPTTAVVSQWSLDIIAPTYELCHPTSNDNDIVDQKVLDARVGAIMSKIDSLLAELK